MPGPTAPRASKRAGSGRVALRLGELIAALGGELRGDPDAVIEGIAPLESALPSQISFLSNPRYGAQMSSTRAGCVIVPPAMAAVAQARGTCIVVDEPYLYFARVTQLWRRRSGAPRRTGVHPTAVVDPTAHVHPSAWIGPLCVIERAASVGENSMLYSRVTVGEGCRIGARAIVHAGVVIGADGFGFAPNNGAWEKIEQLGSVQIGDDVEIGANTCIDRGALADTVLEDGVKLDNLIQIGHNVRVGRHTAMAGCVGVAGSAVIGAHCTLGGGAIVLGHLHLADHVHISAATVVTRSITRPGHYTGMFPIDDNANWEKNAATLRHLHSLRERLRALEKQTPGR